MDEMDLSAAPAQPAILFDLEQCILRYAERVLRARDPPANGHWALFKDVWTTLRMHELFQMRKSCARVHSLDETEEKWVEILLRAAVYHLQPAVHPCLHERTGGLFLVYCLYTKQPTVGPPVPVPVAEAEWPCFKQLWSELRDARDADAFKALHNLWEIGAFRPVKIHFHWLSDLQAAQGAQEEATKLALKAGEEEAASGFSSCLLGRMLDPLRDLELKYIDAWKAASEGTGTPRSNRTEHGLLYDALQMTQKAGEGALAVAREEDLARQRASGGLGSSHSFRERKRAQAYNPQRKRRTEEVGACASVFTSDRGVLEVRGRSSSPADADS